jgi:hypothetical protein
MIYAAFGFVTAVVSFVFLVDPALRPDPRETQIATLQGVAFDEGISFRGYAERVGQGNSPEVAADGAAACVPGNIVYLSESLQGFKNRPTTLRFLTLNAVTHQRIRGAPDSVSGGGPALDISGEVPSDQSVSLQWVQWPSNPGSYIVRFELFRGQSLLAVADTPKFVVTNERYAGLFRKCEAQRQSGKLSEGGGYAEASIGGSSGGGFDLAQALLYLALACAAGLVGTLIFSRAARLWKRQP